MFVYRIRCPLKIIPLSIPAILLFYWFVHGMRVQAQVSQTSKVRELQEQRLATLREVARLASLSAEVGHKNPEELWAAIKARGEAELELCTSNAERIGVLEKLVAEVKGLEAQAAKLVSSQFLSETSFLKLKADRLKQEILLEQARVR